MLPSEQEHNKSLVDAETCYELDGDLPKFCLNSHPSTCAAWSTMDFLGAIPETIECDVCYQVSSKDNTNQKYSVVFRPDRTFNLYIGNEFCMVMPTDEWM